MSQVIFVFEYFDFFFQCMKLARRYSCAYIKAIFGECAYQRYCVILSLSFIKCKTRLK